MDELPFSEGKKSSEKNRRKELPGYLCFFVCVCVCVCVCVYVRGREYVCMCVPSHVLLFATPWAVAYQPPLCMEFSRQV